MLKVQQSALDLWKVDQQALGASEKSARNFGAALNTVREAMPRGGYTQWLKQNGIDRNRANYCMRVASGKQKANAEKTTSAVPEGFKKISILLKAPIYERLVLIAKAERVELGKYVSNVVTKHAVAQKEFANEILAAIASEDRAREQTIKQEMKREKAAAANA
jgi:hypothetical protein